MLLGKRQSQENEAADEHAFSQSALHVGGMVGVQYHNQHVQECDPWNKSLGEDVMPGQAEEEHSARFVWQMAAASAAKQPKG